MSVFGQTAIYIEVLGTLQITQPANLVSLVFDQTTQLLHFTLQRLQFIEQLRIAPN